MFWGRGTDGAGLAALLHPTVDAAARRLSTVVNVNGSGLPTADGVSQQRLLAHGRPDDEDGLSALERAGAECLAAALGAVGAAVRAKLVEPLAPERVALATAAPRALGAAFPDAVRSEDPLYFEVLQAAAERGASTTARGKPALQYAFDRQPVPRAVQPPSLVSKSVEQRRAERSAAHAAAVATYLPRGDAVASGPGSAARGRCDDRASDGGSAFGGVGPDWGGATSDPSPLRWAVQQRGAAAQLQQRAEHLLSLLVRERRAEVRREERLRGARARFHAALATAAPAGGGSRPTLAHAGTSAADAAALLATVDARAAVAFLASLSSGDSGGGGIATAAVAPTEAMPPAPFERAGAALPKSTVGGGGGGGGWGTRSRVRRRGAVSAGVAGGGGTRRLAPVGSSTAGAGAASSRAGETALTAPAAPAIALEREVLAVARERCDAADGLMRVAEAYGFVSAAAVAAFLRGTLAQAAAVSAAGGAGTPRDGMTQWVGGDGDSGNGDSADSSSEDGDAAACGDGGTDACLAGGGAATARQTCRPEPEPAAAGSARGSTRRQSLSLSHRRGRHPSLAGRARARSPTWSDGRVLGTYDVPGKDFRPGVDRFAFTLAASAGPAWRGALLRPLDTAGISESTALLLADLRSRPREPTDGRFSHLLGRHVAWTADGDGGLHLPAPAVDAGAEAEAAGLQARAALHATARDGGRARHADASAAPGTART